MYLERSRFKNWIGNVAMEIYHYESQENPKIKSKIETLDNRFIKCKKILKKHIGTFLVFEDGDFN